MIPHENIYYKQNLPFSANFVNVLDEPVHCHKEIEILLLLRGFCRYKIYHMTYDLQPGDMIISDVEDLHRIHDSSEDVLMLQVHLDTGKFEEMYPNIRATYFVCEDPGSRAKDDAALRSNQLLLRHQLAKLIMDAYGSPRDFVLQTDNINQLLATLVGHFRGFYMEDYQYRIGRTDVSETDLDRMSRITHYLLSNYDSKVTLENVAASEHLSPYYVSHLIKKTLGITFQHLLNGIRLEFAEKSLLFTSHPLTRVSEDSGFSSLNYFNKCFHDWYGFTPSHYRKTIPQGVRRSGQAISSTDALDMTGKYLTPVVAIQKISLAPFFHESQAESLVYDAVRPRILLSTQEDLMGLGFLKDRISAIKPAALLVNRRLLTTVALGALHTLGIPVESFDADDTIGLKNPWPNPDSGQRPVIRSTAAALSNILAADGKPDSSGMAVKHETPIPLFGDQNALFMKNGLATPFFTAYQLLVAMDGQILDRTRQSIQCRSRKQLAVLLFNPDSREILNVGLHTKNLPEQFILMKKQIPEENNCFGVLDALGHPDNLPGDVVLEIDQSHLGIPQFQMVDKAVSPVLDLMVYPQHVTLLVISSLTSRSPQ